MTQLFIYTRLEKFDYRLVYAPSKENLPEPIRGEYINFAREIVNTDNFDEIDRPRYALLKRGDTCLIGVGCYNELLGACDSAHERRKVRGFFGIIFYGSTKGYIEMLLDLEIYKKIYESYLSPLWSLSKKDEIKTNSVVQDIEINQTSLQSTPCFLELNTYNNVCKIFNESSDIISLFIKSNDYENVDIVCNLSSRDHIKYAPLFKFHNVTIVGNDVDETIILPSENGKRVVPKDAESQNEASDSVNDPIDRGVEELVEDTMKGIREVGKGIRKVGKIIIGVLSSICENNQNDNSRRTDRRKAYKRKSVSKQEKLISKGAELNQCTKTGNKPKIEEIKELQALFKQTKEEKDESKGENVNETNKKQNVNKNIIEKIDL